MNRELHIKASNSSLKSRAHDLFRCHFRLAVEDCEKQFAQMRKLAKFFSSGISLTANVILRLDWEMATLRLTGQSLMLIGESLVLRFGGGTHKLHQGNGRGYTYGGKY